MSKRDIRSEVLARAQGAINIDTKETALLVIDMLNDGCRSGGAFDTIGFDITPFQNIEPALVRLARACQLARIPLIYSVTYYDPAYLPPALLKNFTIMGVLETNFARKGTWGVQVIDSLPANPDYIVVKSHYSCFAPAFSLVYERGANSEFENYMTLRSEEDEMHKRRSKPTLSDYYAMANKSLLGVTTLDDLLKSNGITTLIISGGSTHVCLGATVWAASERNFRIILPIDTIASEDEVKHWVMLHNFMHFNAELTKSDSLGIILRKETDNE